MFAFANRICFSETFPSYLNRFLRPISSLTRKDLSVKTSVNLRKVGQLYKNVLFVFITKTRLWLSSNTVSTLTKLISLRLSGCQSEQCSAVQPELPHLQFESWDWSESEAIRLKLRAAGDVLLHYRSLHLPINTGRGFSSLWDTIEIKELSVMNWQLPGGIRLKTSRRNHTQHRELEHFNISIS